MARSGLELSRSLKHAHATPRDSFSFCLKDRTSIRRLTTPEMGKKDKQKLEHRVSQSPWTHPMVLLGDAAQVEALFDPFEESANLDAR